MQPIRRGPFWPDWHIGLAAAIAGFVTVIWANDSQHLPGLMSDGVQYLTAAESLADLRLPMIPVGHWSQETLESPLLHYPPGFPAAIAVPVALGVDSPNAAVIVMAIAAGATLAVTFALGATLSGIPGGLFALVLVGFYPEWIRLHTAVWSEPIYLPIFLLAVLAMLRRPRDSAMHGFLAMCLVTIRFVGIATTALVGGLALTGERTNRRYRLALALGPSIAFLGAWVLLMPHGNSTSRRVGFYGGGEDWGSGFVTTLAHWAAPGMPIPVGVMAFAAAMLLLVRSGVWRTAVGHGFLRLALGASVVHAMALIAGRTFFDPRIPMDARMVLPIMILFAIGLGACLGRLVTNGGIQASLAIVVVTVWAIRDGVVIHNGVATIKESGQFYTQVMWQSSPPIEWARMAVSQGLDLYSNEPEMIYLYTGKPARQAPVQGEDLIAWRQAWGARPGPLVMLDPPRPIDLPPAALLEGLPIKLLVGSPQGAVFWR